MAKKKLKRTRTSTKAATPPRTAISLFFDTENGALFPSEVEDSAHRVLSALLTARRGEYHSTDDKVEVRARYVNGFIL